MITGLFIGLHGLLLVVLSAAVIRQRFAHNVAFGDGSAEPLQRAIRVQANFVEYVPLCLLVLAGLEWLQANTIGLFALGSALFIGRVLHAVGLSQNSNSSKPRAIGAVLTLAVLLLGSLWLLFQSALALM